MNHALFLLINHWAQVLPDGFWSSLTVLGHTAAIAALFCAFLQRDPRLLTALAISGVLGGGLIKLAKELWLTPRPPALLPPEAFHLIGWKLDWVSFPSGHTTTAFVAAVLLMRFLPLRPWQSVLLVGLATLVGLSRIAVGVHWPLDVLAGAALGSAIAWIAAAISQWLHGHHQQRTSTKALDFMLARLLAMVMWGISASLLWIDSGYPLAQGLTVGLALFGCAFATIRLITLRAPRI